MLFGFTKKSEEEETEDGSNEVINHNILHSSIHIRFGWSYSIAALLSDMFHFQDACDAEELIVKDLDRVRFE